MISQVGIYTYNAAKVIADYLRPLYQNEYKINNTQSFPSMLKDQTPFNSNEQYVWHDIESLFTCIPMNETISYIINTIFQKNKFPQIWSNLNQTKFCLRHFYGILVALDKEQDSLIFLILLNNMHPNIKFTIEKQINHFIAFLDVFLSVINNQNFTLQTYHKSTYIVLLLNVKSFTSFSYKISLIKWLIHRTFKICNSGNSFHNDIESIKPNLIKDAWPPFLIDKVIKKHLNYKFSNNQNQLKDTSDVFYFKLPYIDNLSHYIKNKLSRLCKAFCKENFIIELVFTSFKTIFHVKTQFLMIWNLS